MRFLLLMVLFLTSDLAFSQGTAIPDGLDCENLTAEYAAYAEYCKDVEAVINNAGRIKSAAGNYEDEVEVIQKLKNLKAKGWEAVSGKNYDDAIAYFEEALAIHESLGSAFEGYYYIPNLTALVEKVKEDREFYASLPERVDLKDENAFWNGAENINVKDEGKSDKNKPVTRSCSKWYVMVGACNSYIQYRQCVLKENDEQVLVQMEMRATRIEEGATEGQRTWGPFSQNEDDPLMPFRPEYHQAYVIMFPLTDWSTYYANSSTFPDNVKNKNARGKNEYAYIADPTQFNDGSTFISKEFWIPKSWEFNDSYTGGYRAKWNAQKLWWDKISKKTGRKLTNRQGSGPFYVYWTCGRI